MELHRRCSRSNIPALVMLLLQLSVVLSGAAAVSFANWDMLYEEEQADQIVPEEIDLLKFEWDGSDATTTLTICTSADTLGTEETVQIVLVTSMSPHTEIDVPGILNAINETCADFPFPENPFDDTKENTFELSAVDTVANTAKVGFATFSVQAEEFPGYKIMCGTETPYVLYRVNDEDDKDCLNEVGFDSEVDICYTETLPSMIGCQMINDSYNSADIEVCQPYSSEPTPVEVVEGNLNVLLSYDGPDSKAFSFTSTPELHDATIAEAIVQINGNDTYTVYRGTVDSTSTGLPPSADLYNLCVVGLATAGSDDIVPLGIGSIQDTNLNLFDKGGLLEFGFINLNAEDEKAGGKIQYAITATADGTKADAVTLDCTAVLNADICFGYLKVDASTSGTLSVAFKPDDTNVITTPYVGGD